jgi:Putative metallopeptidase
MRRATLAAALVGLTQWLSPMAATAEPQVSVVYGDAPAGDAALVHAHDILVKSQALDELGTFLSPLRLPADLHIRSDACGGASRRPYDPATKTVTICYEMIARILDVAKAQSDASDADRKQAILGTIVEALFHETAYALFDLFDVPIWGRLDDAADRLAAFVMMQFGEDNARTTILGSALFFNWSARTWTGKDFASTEAPEAQRFYNFLCIAYGGDPIAFDNLKTNGALPEYRSAQCAKEYQQVRKAFDLRLMPFIDPDLLVKARARTW